MKKETTNQKLDKIIKLLEQLHKNQTPGNIYLTNPGITKPTDLFNFTNGYHCSKCGAWAINGQPHICNFNVMC